MAESRRAAKGYMPDRVSLTGIGIAGVLIVVAIVLGALGALAAIRLGNDGRAPSAGVARVGAPPPIETSSPLRPDPAQDTAAFVAEKRSLLSQYAWTDRDRGIARIPIDRAMTLLAEQSAAKTRKP